MAGMDQEAGTGEGYEMWHPNREKASSSTTKAIVALVLVLSAALLVIITLGGFERLQSPSIGFATIAWGAMYLGFAFLVMNWQRGLLPVASVMAIVMVVFAGVAAPGWFARDKSGLDSPLLPEDLLGLLTLVLIPVQLLLVVVAMVAFSQEWHVEEERPIEGHEAHDDPDDGYDDGHAAHAEADDDYADEGQQERGSSSGGWSPPSTSAS